MSQITGLKILLDHFHRMQEGGFPILSKGLETRIRRKEELLVKILIVWANISGIDSEYKRYYFLT